MSTREEELEGLFRKHYRQMYRLAFQLLHDDAESKDIVHDVFAQLLSSPDLVVHGEKSASFLLTCVRNRCLNVMRNRRIQERVQRLYLFDVDNKVIPGDSFDEELRNLLLAVSLLAPPVCRKVIEMHFRDGLTFREIAQSLDVSETTVYKYLRNALQQLRAHLKKDQ